MWEDEGGDGLESMAEEMIVHITAGNLRSLLDDGGRYLERSDYEALEGKVNQLRIRLEDAKGQIIDGEDPYELISAALAELDSDSPTSE